MVLEWNGHTVFTHKFALLSRLLGLITLWLSIAFLSACSPEPQEQPRKKDYVITSIGEKAYFGPGEGEKVGIIQTEHGRIALELWENIAPNTVSNFCYLAGDGFYDGLAFYRVAPGFAIQTGDPKGDGTGGPGYRIPPEIVESDTIRHVRGTVAMDIAGADAGGAGSRFYICLSKQPQLDGHFPIFGQVVEGYDVLDRIREGDRIESVEVLLKNEYLKQREKGR
jgi:peptidyl-prolyl cis-trans isomerase B (cyclophilin B)